MAFGKKKGKDALKGSKANVVRKREDTIVRPIRFKVSTDNLIYEEAIKEGRTMNNMISMILDAWASNKRKEQV